jgi:D-alanine-D-alanine ligase
MSIRRVAILYNSRPPIADPSLPDDTFEEFDCDDTINAIAAAIEELRISAVPVVADHTFPRVLENGRFDLVFNIAEGEGGRCREAVPAAICEFLRIPFSGSDPLTLAVTLDKAMARRIISPDIAVARGVLYQEPADLDQLRFPVVVKPNHEGSSKGIRKTAYCCDRAAAVKQCGVLHERYRCPVLIEEFLPGAEVTIGIVGNNPPRVLGCMEIAPREETATPFLYSLEVKRQWRDHVRYHIPPRVPHKTAELLDRFAMEAYRILGCRDVARMDFRIDCSGMPRFIECNPLPGLNPKNSDIVIMSRGVLSYNDLVTNILTCAAERYGMTL